MQILIFCPNMIPIKRVRNYQAFNLLLGCTRILEKILIFGGDMRILDLFAENDKNGEFDCFALVGLI